MANIIYTPSANGIKLYAEIKDRFYADVDKWHFLIVDDFETKDALKKSLENGGYLVSRIYTEEEYLNYLRSIDTHGMDEEELDNLHLTIQHIEENLNYECLVSNGDC